MGATPTPLPPEVYAVFSGPINGETVTRLITGFTTASAQNVKHIHMMFHSTGGLVGDGVALYNFLKVLPFDLTLYNPGIVASIGVIAYLGAKNRKVSTHGVFMIHRTQCNIGQGTPADRAQTIVDSAILDDKRTEAILRERMTMPAERWAYFNHNDLYLSAKEAVEYGVAQEIAEFAPPLGTRIFTA